MSGDVNEDKILAKIDDIMDQFYRELDNAESEFHQDLQKIHAIALKKMEERMRKKEEEVLKDLEKEVSEVS